MNKWVNKEKHFRIDDSTKRVLIIAGASFLVLLLIIIVIVQKSSENYNNIKIDKNNYLVYSKIEKPDNTYSKYVPYINIKSNAVIFANQEIDNFVSNYIDSPKALVTYEYNINGIILSVVVKVMDFNDEYAPVVDFRTYNINLKTRQVLSDDELLSLFQTNTDSVSSSIRGVFEKYYSDLVNEGYYVESECNYDCFLKYRDVYSYMDNVHYYIKDGNLIAYKPFVFYSILGDEEYFKAEDFEFLLAESNKN